MHTVSPSHFLLFLSGSFVVNDGDHWRFGNYLQSGSILVLYNAELTRNIMNTVNPLLSPLLNSKELGKKSPPPGGLNKGFTVKELRHIFACVMSAWSSLKSLQGGGGGG